MSRKKPQSKYTAQVKKNGTGAKIRAFKEHIGKTAEIKIIDAPDSKGKGMSDLAISIAETINKGLK